MTGPGLPPPAPTSSGYAPTRVTTGDSGARLGQRRMLLLLGIVFVVVIGVGAVVALAGPGPEPPPPCPPGSTECGGPPRPIPSTAAATPGPIATSPPSAGPAAPRLERGEAWISPDLGFRLLYDPGVWTVSESSGTHVALEDAVDGSFGVIVEGVAAGDYTPEELVDAELALQRKVAPDLVLDTSTFRMIQDPSIGYVDSPEPGVTYVGHLDRTDGIPGSPIAFSIAAATKGELTVVVAVWTLEPDRVDDGYDAPRDLTTRQFVDDLLKDFEWPA